MTKETNRFTHHEPCTTPGCTWKYGFHICLNRGDMKDVVLENAKPRKPLSERGARMLAANPDIKYDIQKDYVENWMTIAQLGEKYYAHKDTIRGVLKQLGVEIRTKGATPMAYRIKHHIDVIAKDYVENGLTTRELAAKYDVPAGSVRHALLKHGVTLRGKHRRTAVMLETLNK